MPNPLRSLPLTLALAASPPCIASRPRLLPHARPDCSLAFARAVYSDLPSAPPLGLSAFVPRGAPSAPWRSDAARRDRGGGGEDRTRGGGRSCLKMLRNFDLPEAIIFYGTDVVLTGASSSSPRIRPGVLRLVDECAEVGTAALVLTEARRSSDLESLISPVEGLGSRLDGGALILRSSLDADALVFPPEADDDRLPFGAGGTGHAPSPAALIDSISSVCITPRGFGGSGGFGTKAADPPRPPLPKHCVVFVSGPSERSRARCSAARMAGMRVVYVEVGGLGSCDAEDLADAVVESLGDESDWEAVTLDGISTPGSYWLNPPNPRDDDGNRVDIEEAVQLFRRKRMEGGSEAATAAGTEDLFEEEGEMDEDEMSRILADLDSL